MIVDDDPELAYVLSQFLEPRYETIIAANGLEALERLDRYEPDVIVMDVTMPVLDGYDTTRAIKKNARFADVPILFLTGNDDNESVRAGLMSGGEMYLIKPFETVDFLKHLEDIINRDNVVPRPKSFRLHELKYQYYPDQPPPPPIPMTNDSQTSGRPKTLSERFAEVAAEPRLRVLAVDDDLDITNYVRICLQSEFEVIGTTDSESAPDKIIAYQPDILLLDIMMPRLNGFHLSYLIRLNKRLKGAKIIFVSSRNDREAVEQAFRLGASDFLEKPFSPEQLRRKILDVTRRPDFHRSKKRISFSEVMRREGITAEHE